MSKSEIDRLLTDIKTDPKLQAAIGEKARDLAALVPFLKQRGYDITAEDIRAHVRAQNRELTEEELDTAAGGTVIVPHYVLQA